MMIVVKIFHRTRKMCPVFKEIDDDDPVAMATLERWVMNHGYDFKIVGKGVMVAHAK